MKKYSSLLEKREDKDTRSPSDISVQDHKENRAPHQLKHS